jgi:putative transposase
MGNLLRAVVHAADWTENEGGILLMASIVGLFSSLGRIWTDQGYQTRFIEWVQAHFACRVEVVRKPDGQQGFQVQPRRWIVERSLAWESRCRRLSKDYEYWEENSATFLYLASIQRLLKRAANPP